MHVPCTDPCGVVRNACNEVNLDDSAWLAPGLQAGKYSAQPWNELSGELQSLTPRQNNRFNNHGDANNPA